jgi:serine/threonine-protein kinase
VTAIQAKVDERFQRETQVLFRARLITAARLTGIVLLLLILFDAALTWTKGADFPGPQLAVTHLILGVLTLLLAGLLGARDTGSLQLTDLLLFLPAAAGVVASVGFSGGTESPYVGVYIVLVAVRTALVPGPRASHVLTVVLLILLFPVGLFGMSLLGALEGTGPDPVLLSVESLVVALVAGVGLLASDMTHAMHERLVSMRSMGRYKIQKELGRGAMGVVYLAWHRDLGRPCVIKFVHPEKDSSGALRHRFEREARETSLLRSPYTVQVFDFGVTQKGELYYVMEFLEGESLQDRLATGGAQPFDLVCRWMSFACESLAEAHARGLIHRDVKPANLYLSRTADGREAVKVLDFGIARKEPTEQPQIVLSNSSVAALPTEADLTAVGTVMGTPLYVAPEVLAGRAANPQADLYSLAATGFHLLTGRPLFTGKSIEQLLRRTLRDEAPVPSSLVPAAGIPPALDRIFQRALSKNPSERPESMEAFRRSLEPFSAAAGASRSLISNQDSRSTE